MRRRSEVEGEGSWGGLVCNLASPARLAGGGNLGGLISPELAALLHPPAARKHNGSPWYRADCSFIRAKKWSRPGESGSVSLSLSDELVYFSSSRRAREAPRTELIGERPVHRGAGGSGIEFHPTTGQSPPCQKSVFQNLKKKRNIKKSLIGAF